MLGSSAGGSRTVSSPISQTRGIGYSSRLPLSTTSEMASRTLGVSDSAVGAILPENGALSCETFALSLGEHGSALWLITFSVLSPGNLGTSATFCDAIGSCRSTLSLEPCKFRSLVDLRCSSCLWLEFRGLGEEEAWGLDSPDEDNDSDRWRSFEATDVPRILEILPDRSGLRLLGW